MTLPVTLDPLECNTLIRRLNDTNREILNNCGYKKTSTVREDHYFTQCIPVPLLAYLLIELGLIIHSDIPDITVQLITNSRSI